MQRETKYWERSVKIKIKNNSLKCVRVTNKIQKVTQKKMEIKKIM